MAVRSLRELKGWRLQDSALDIRGQVVVDHDGRTLGTVVDLGVNTMTELAESALLDTGLSFPLHRLERNGTGLQLQKEQE